jgi:hypothetical protein
MIETSELQLTAEDHDKAFVEVCFLLDMFIDTIEKFVGKSTPSLAVAAGRKMALNMPIHLDEPTPENALGELVRVFTIQQMKISAEMQGGDALVTIDHCPIGAVCRERKMELDGAACQMFHYYVGGILAEFTGRPVRPTTLVAGEICTFKMTFAGAPKRV